MSRYAAGPPGGIPSPSEGLALRSPPWAIRTTSPPGIQPSPPAASLVDHAKGLASHHPGPQQRRCSPAHLPQPEHRQVLYPHDLPQDRRRQPRPEVLRGIDTASHPTATASTTGAAHPYHWQMDVAFSASVSLPTSTRMALRLEPSAGQGRAARPTGGGGAVRGWQKTMTRPARDRDPRPHNRGEIRPDAWRHTSKPWTSTCCRGATPTPERVASRPHPPCRSCHESHPQSEGCGDTGDRALRDRPDLWWCRSLVAGALGADPLPPATIDRPVGWPVR